MILPLGARVLCREPLTDESLLGSRIVLLDDTRRRITANQGEVVAVGPGSYDEDQCFVPMDPSLKPGAWILHRAWARVETDDPELFIVAADDILAVLDTAKGEP